MQLTQGQCNGSQETRKRRKEAQEREREASQRREDA